MFGPGLRLYGICVHAVLGGMTIEGIYRIDSDFY